MSGGVLRIWFARRSEPSKPIVFVAAPFRGSCRAGTEKSFQTAGVKTWWGRTSNEQQAWRCLPGVELAAATAMAPTRFAPVGFARVAASGHRIVRRRRAVRAPRAAAARGPSSPRPVGSSA